MNGWNTFLLTFPVSAAAKNVFFDLEGSDRSAAGWHVDVGDAAGPNSLGLINGGIYFSKFSTQPSADRRQFLVTCAVSIPATPQNRTRLFRLKLRQ